MKWMIRALIVLCVTTWGASAATAATIYWNFSGSNGTESVAGFLRFDTPGTPSGFVPFGNRRNFVDQATLSWAITGGVLDGDTGSPADHDIYLDQGFAAQSILRASGGPTTDFSLVTFNSNTLFLWGVNVESLPSGSYTIPQFNIAHNFSRTLGTETINITIDTLSVATAPIPEPSTGLLIASGLTCLGARARNRRRR